MTITKTETGFNLISDLLQQFEEGDTLKVSIVSNCCSTEIEEEFTEVGESLDIETDLVFIEAVLTFKITLISGDHESSELLCYFNEEDLACKVGEFILDNCNSDVHFDYFMLISMQNCACDCDNMCEIYKRILKKIDQEFCCDKITGKPCHSC
jgi:hypothetical protein